MTSTVLILSPYFPPSSLAGVHRARHLAKHLPAHGWRPIIVCAHERCYSEANDPALAALVPDQLEQVRTGAFPVALCRIAGIGDIGLRAWPHFRHAIHRLIVAERPDAVFITGSPFFPMLLAGRIWARFGLPVILDFQDPWVSAQGLTQPKGSKAWLAHRLAVALEPIAVRNAAFVTSVSDIQNQQMAVRYPWLDPDRMAAIPIGVDPDDFAATDAAQCIKGSIRLDSSKINLTYVGTFLPRAGPIVQRLFAALAELHRRSPDLAARIRLNFVGTSNQPSGVGGHRVLPYAQSAGLADFVHEVPERIPYVDALRLMAKSSASLLIGSDEPHYTASKIYPALLSGRPYLSLFHRDSSAHRILTAAGGGRAIAFADLKELEGLTPEIAEALSALATAPETFGAVRAEALEPYTAHSVAGQFAAIFSELAGRR